MLRNYLSPMTTHDTISNHCLKFSTQELHAQMSLISNCLDRSLTFSNNTGLLRGMFCDHIDLNSLKRTSSVTLYVEMCFPACKLYTITSLEHFVSLSPNLLVDFIPKSSTFVFSDLFPSFIIITCVQRHHLTFCLCDHFYFNGNFKLSVLVDNLF